MSEAPPNELRHGRSDKFVVDLDPGFEYQPTYHKASPMWVTSLEFTSHNLQAPFKVNMTGVGIKKDGTPGQALRTASWWESDRYPDAPEQVARWVTAAMDRLCPVEVAGG